VSRKDYTDRFTLTAASTKLASPAERILAAADRLFYSQGIHVGVDAVAAEAGVSKRTLYNHYATKNDLVAAYLLARFRHIAPSDAPAREQLLGYFDYLERVFASPAYRGCPYVNAVCELSDPRHPAAIIARRFKLERREWIRALLLRLGASDPDELATQIQLLIEGAVASTLVRGDPALARAARGAAETLLDASLNPSSDRRVARRRTRRRSDA